ncbi:unnamed protein product [Gordionus sp. m RMFG-2023]|uniref:large ribosomal subunit protein uL11m-like n=1 Tax=Gordionus sp. m RMFG-2023 TaxID=3053472 RepID=UPI0030DE4091
MSKRLAQVKKGKKLLDKVKVGNFLRLKIPAGKASAAPPLGPQLGQHSVNVAQFCKEFNQKTENVRYGVPIPCSIKINPDRTYNLTIHPPTATYFLFSAAGIVRGAMNHAKEHAGMLSLKHIYEVAKVKIEDPNLLGISMSKMCRMLIGTCHSLGIKVVKQLDTQEYEKFLQERDKVVEDQIREIQEKKQAKLLRTIT